MLRMKHKYDKMACGVLEASFDASEMMEPSCKLNSTDIIIDKTVLTNFAWGVKIRKLFIELKSDRNGVNICEGLRVESCSARGQVLKIPIRTARTDYWEGEQITITVRICTLPSSDFIDYNISYAIRGTPTTRDLEDDTYIESILIKSNLYVHL